MAQSTSGPAGGSTFAIAGFKTIYSTHAVGSALEELPAGANDALRGTYAKMIRLGGERFCVKPGRMPDFDGLAQELPNFAQVLADLRRQLALCLETDDPLEIAPMLLLGEPGIGKTHFAKRLSQLLGTGYGFVPMSSLTAGWVLSGASSQWKGARPGKVFETLVDGQYANPVMVVDEIDKASAEHAYDPLGALYSLLEIDTACSFTDEFAEVPIDASQVIWIATANDERAIPEPILNRMNVYQVEAPDHDAARGIALRLYQRIRGSHDWGVHFEPEPSEAVLDQLAALAPREMRRAWMTAFGNARLDQRGSVELRDLPAPSSKRGPIGFVQ
jgi:ATP-dependent Lon protease